MPLVVAEKRLGLRADPELQAARLERLLQHPARDLVELALHQPRHEVNDRHRHAAQHQAVGGLEAEQAAADHDRVLVRLRRLDHRVGVGDVAVGDDAVEVLARQRRDERVRAGRDQEPVVRRLGAVVGDGDPAAAMDVDHLLAEVQRDAVLGVPLDRVEDDVGERLLAGQHRREQDAVVVRVRLGAEHGDVVQVGSDLQQLLERAHAGHAVADHHEIHLLHCRRPEGSRADRRGWWCAPCIAARMDRTAPGRRRDPR